MFEHPFTGLDASPKLRVHEVGVVNNTETTYEFEFEPDLGRQHLETVVFRGNSKTETFDAAARAWVAGLWKSYIIAHARKIEA